MAAAAQMHCVFPESFTAKVSSALNAAVRSPLPGALPLGPPSLPRGARAPRQAATRPSGRPDATRSPPPAGLGSPPASPERRHRLCPTRLDRHISRHEMPSPELPFSETLRYRRPLHGHAQLQSSRHRSKQKILLPRRSGAGTPFWPAPMPQQAPLQVRAPITERA